MFGRKKKTSFFDRLTGTIPIDDLDADLDEEEYMDEEEEIVHHQNQPRRGLPVSHHMHDEIEEEEEIELPETEGELAVDVLQTDDEIIIKAMVAGVKPGDLDVDITRDMVTIHGTREETTEIEDDNYFHQELYWGSFSRNILLPEEIDVDLAEASEKHGLLIIKLPKLDKNRKTKLQVKSK